MKRLPAFVLTAALGAAPVLAHDTWLLPERFRASRGEVVTAQATSAMRFPVPETPVKADRIARSGLRLGGRSRELMPAEAGGGALPLRAALDGDGVAVLWFESLPRTLDLKDAEVEEYLGEIGLWDTVGAEWRKGGRKPWRETYAKLAKTFVRVGATPDRAWAEPVGLGFEIVPEGDPTAARAGEDLAFVVRRDGKPAAGQAVAAQPSGGRAVLKVADARGRVSFALDREGPWLVKATSIRPGARPGEWESRFTTLTLGVGPARR